MTGESPDAIEEDLKKSEDAERETQEELQVPFLDEIEVDHLKKFSEAIGESMIFLRQYIE